MISFCFWKIFIFPSVFPTRNPTFGFKTLQTCLLLLRRETVDHSIKKTRDLSQHHDLTLHLGARFPLAPLQILEHLFVHSRIMEDNPTCEME